MKRYETPIRDKSLPPPIVECGVVRGSEVERIMLESHQRLSAAVDKIRSERIGTMNEFYARLYRSR